MVKVKRLAGFIQTMGKSDDWETVYMLESVYLPKEELVEITYCTESMEKLERVKYEIDLSKITFWEYIGR